VARTIEELEIALRHLSIFASVTFTVDDNKYYFEIGYRDIYGGHWAHSRVEASSLQDCIDKAMDCIGAVTLALY